MNDVVDRARPTGPMTKRTHLEINPMRHLLLTITAAALLLPIQCVCGEEDVTPRSVRAGSTLAIDGPDEAIPADEDAYLRLDGLTLTEIQTAKNDGLFDLTVFPLDGVRVHASYDWLNDTLELSFRASDPGEYLVKLHLVRAGTLEIAAATVTVEGEQRPDPQPTPDPDPLPDGLKVVFVLEESSTRTASQAEAMTALRRWCQAQGLPYRQLDQDQPSVGNWASPYKSRISSDGVALPALVASVQRGDGTVYFADVTPLPGGPREAVAAVEEAFGQ